MSQKARRVLLTLLFGVVQILGLVLVVVIWYYIGRTEVAYEIMEYSGDPLTIIECIGTGFVFFLLTLCILALAGGIGFLIYQWGKFTQKKARKWNKKINRRIKRRREAKILRARHEPDWEV